MKYIKMLLCVCLFSAMQSAQASYFRAALIAASRSSTKVKELIVVKSKEFQNKFTTNEAVNVSKTESTLHRQSSMPPVAQAAKSESEQAATASGFLNFAKNSTATTNHNTYNYNYAKKTLSESFFAWVENGKYTRAAGAGFVLGGLSGYGAHALVVSHQKEKFIVVQG